MIDTNVKIDVLYLRDVGWKIKLTDGENEIEGYGEELSHALYDLTEQVEAEEMN